MSAFLWFVLVCELLTAVSRIILLATGRTVEAGVGSHAINLIFGLGVIAWTIVLLARGAA